MKTPSLNFVAGLFAGVALCLAVNVWRHRSVTPPALPDATAVRRVAFSPCQGGRAPAPRLVTTPASVAKRLRSVLGVGDPLDRTRAMLAYVGRLQTEDFRVNLECCQDLGLPTGSEEYEMLMTAWAKRDRTAALAFAGNDREAVRMVLDIWSATDPEAAHEWVQSHHSGEDPNALLGTVIPAIAAGDEQRALDLIGSLPREDRWFVFHQMAPRLVQQGPDVVKAWLDRVPEKLRSEATAQMAGELPASDSSAAVEWLKDDRQAARAANVMAIFRNWADTDGDAATAAFENLPPGHLHQEALRGLAVQQLSHGNQDAALDLMDRHAEAVDDSMLGTWVAAALPERPAQSMDQILTVRDPELRTSIYRKASHQWFQSDPRAAQEWLDRRALPVAAALEYVGR